MQGLDDLHPDEWKTEVIREMSLDAHLEGFIKAVQQCVAGSVIVQMIVGDVQLMLLFDGSLDASLCEPGVIHEEIHHLGRISWILKVCDGVHPCILEVLE